LGAKKEENDVAVGTAAAGALVMELFADPSKIAESFKQAQKMFGDGIGKGMGGMAGGFGDILKAPANIIGGIQKGIMGGISNVLKASGLIKLVTIAGFIYLIYQSSKRLQLLFSRFMKLIMMVLRPIGDAISMILTPLMAILKPFALVMRLMWKFYGRQAMEAARAATTFFGAGMEQKAFESLGLVFVAIGGFLIEAVTRGVAFGMSVFIDLFMKPIELLAMALAAIGVIPPEWVDQIIAFKLNMKENLNEMVDGAMQGMRAWLFDTIAGYSEAAANVRIIMGNMKEMSKEQRIFIQTELEKIDMSPLSEQTIMMTQVIADETVKWQEAAQKARDDNTIDQAADAWINAAKKALKGMTDLEGGLTPGLFRGTTTPEEAMERYNEFMDMMGEGWYKRAGIP
jgi:hypothetical protein